MSSQQQQSSISSFPLIWFLLLDSATGDPYKGTSADKVAVSSSADVADFRDAIHLKNSSILTGITSSQLIVYKNKTAFFEGQEEPLKSSHSMNGLGETEKEALIVIVPSSTISPEVDQLDQEFNALKNSEEYQTLAYKNRAWAVPTPTEQEKWEWQLLKEKLDVLNGKMRDYVNIILSANAHLVKKSDKIRKRYKKDTAIKDERLLLSDVAITMWERFQFDCAYEDGPSFGDLKRAAGFKDDGDVRDYFRKKAIGEVEEDKIKDSLTYKEWIWLIGLDQRINQSWRKTLIENEDGSLRLILEHDIYEDGVYLVTNLVHKLYGPEKKVDIIDAYSLE